MKAIHCRLSFLFAAWLVAGVGTGTGDSGGIEEKYVYFLFTFLLPSLPSFSSFLPFSLLFLALI